MIDQLEKIADSHYVDYMELIDYVPIKNTENLKSVHNNKWFKFERITTNKNYYNCSVEISLEDRENNTIQLLGTYYSGVWKFTTPLTEKIFWEYTKLQPNRFNRILKKLADNRTDKNIITFIIRMRIIKRYWRIKFYKFINKFHV